MISSASEHRTPRFWRTTLGFVFLTVALLALGLVLWRGPNALLALPFYALLVAVATALRQAPWVSSLAWLLLRLVGIVPFFAVFLFKVVTSQNPTYALYALGLPLDLPMLPFLAVAFGLLDYVGADSLGAVFVVYCYVIWYGGGGYLVARGASVFVNR